MTKQSSLVSRLRTLSILVAILCGLFVVATFGMQLPSRPWSPVNIDKPTRADSNEKITAIVDSESRRVLILDEQRMLVGMVQCGVLNSPLDTITDICVSNDTIYVAGAMYKKDSNIIARERVVAYDMFGSSEEVVFDTETKNALLPEIKTMDDAEDGTEIVMYHDAFADSGPSKVRVVHVDRSGTSTTMEATHDFGEVFDIGYGSRINEYVILDTTGSISFSTRKDASFESTRGHLFTSIDLADDGTIYILDDTTDSICLLPPTGKGELKTISHEAGYDNLHLGNTTLTMCNLKQNKVIISSLDGSDYVALDSVMPSPRLSAIRLLVLFCETYLALFAAVLLLLRIKRVFTDGTTEGLGAMLASVVVVGVISMAIGYTSYGSYTTLEETRKNEINLFADYLELQARQLSEYLGACGKRDSAGANNWSKKAEDSYAALITSVDGLSTVATNNGVGTYTSIYAKDDKGIFYLYDSSWAHISGSNLESVKGSQEIEEAFKKGTSSTDVTYVTNSHSSTMRRLVFIPSPSDETTAWVIEIGTDLKSFESSVASNQTQRIIALLVLMLVVYLTYVELRECVLCFVRYGQLRHHHDSIAILTRPFSFSVTLLSSIDAVMTTLIARALIQSAGMDNSSMLFALPSVMLGVGLALGQAIYSVLGSRIVIRKLMTRGAIAMVFGAIFASIVVWQANFWLYCVAKLLMAIPFGLLYTLSYSLPRQAESDEVRALAAGGIKRTDTSAAALGTVLGGYTAQLLGNLWVYVLVAVASVAVLLMAWRLLPQTKQPLESNVNTDSHREAVAKLFASRTTLPIIFFLMLPAILSAGYNSFLFPLFSANLGLGSASINNVFVFGQLVVFVFIPTLERLEERYDKWRVATVAVALLGVVFLLFSFNTTLVWATVTIALVGMLCKSADGWKAMWPRSAEAIGLTTGIATGLMFSVRSILLIVQPLVLGALLSISDRASVVVLGIVCSICAVAFYRTTKKTALAPK